MSGSAQTAPTGTSAKQPLKERLVFAGLVALFVALKLWLVAWQRVAAEGAARFDDFLFLNLAHHLQSGAWLGPYDELTLIKGPVYPIWIALVSTLQLPLLPAQQVFHAAACLLAVYALRTVIPNQWARLGLIAVLLFDPATYESTSQRVIREGIYPALSLMVVVCAIEIARRTPMSRARLATWTAALGLFLGLFWLTREEGPWLLPTVVVLLGFAAYQTLRLRTADARIRAATIVVAPALIAAGCFATVAVINWRHYGVATVVELKAPWFKRAYGALSRVGPDNYINMVPVPKPSRELAYGASPAFAELRASIDGPVDAETGVENFTLARFGEMTGTWFIWAFRDAAAMAGHHRSLPEARAYYERLATEIGDACEEGRIPCGPPRASLAPPFRREYLGTAPGALWKMTDIVVGMRQVEIQQHPSVGDESLLGFYREMTHMRVDGLDTSAEPVGVIRAEVLSAIRDLYAWLLYPATALACLSLAVGVLVALRRRAMPLVLVTSVALAAGIALRLALLSYISISSYNIYQGLYLRVLYPLLYLFIATSLAHAFDLYRSRTKRVDAKS